MTVQLDIEHLRGWIGSSHETVDIITPRLANSMAAILDETPILVDGDPAPIGIHWCLSPDIAPMSGLGTDGHPARGAFLPPVPLPRRMWAGGELSFSGDFRVGDSVRRLSKVTDVVPKQGRSGALCFVTVNHEYHTPRGLALSERHDIVYRAIEPSTAEPAKADMPVPGTSIAIDGTATLLMRYSAATFNGHRIHYDRDYCINEEFYPGLVVHGPLQATYMLRMATELAGGQLPGRFAFRGLSPLIDGQTFSVNALAGDDGLTLWVENAAGVMTMKATTGAA